MGRFEGAPHARGYANIALGYLAYQSSPCRSTSKTNPSPISRGPWARQSRKLCAAQSSAPIAIIASEAEADQLADALERDAVRPDAAPDIAPAIDVQAIRLSAGMTQAQFAAAYEFSVRTIQEWERGAKRPSGPARTLPRAIKADPEGLRKALAAA